MFEPKYAYCEKTETWNFVQLTAKVCSVQIVTYLIQSNIMASKLGTMLPTLDDTVEGHFKSEVHENAYEANQWRKNSYSDSENEQKVTMLKNEVCFNVFKALYWLARRGNCVYQNYLLTRTNWKNGCWWF